jgi:hypothetical protein
VLQEQQEKDRDLQSVKERKTIMENVLVAIQPCCKISIVVTEVSQGKINQVTSTPFPVNGIDPFLSEKILFGIGIVGIAIIGLGIASRKRDKDNLAKLK